MDGIISFFEGIGVDFTNLLIWAAIALVVLLALGLIGRFVFGKRSMLVESVSAAIGVLFLYALNIILRSAGAELQQLIAPLPFISVQNDTLQLFSFSDWQFSTLCSELVNLLILAFLMNLADRFMPRGKKLITWLIFRILSLVLTQAAHLLVVWLFGTYMPDVIQIYAPIILLGILILLILIALLKTVICTVLSFISPVLSILYTFFFSNLIGKQLTKSVLTTVILTVLVIVLVNLGTTTISIALGALTAYIPLLLILLVLWYLFNKVF